MNVHDPRLTSTMAMPQMALPRRRIGAFSGAHIAVLTALLLLVVSIPIWTNPVPPLSDYVNHLARMHVIADIAHDPNLSRFYEIDWAPVPNLMMDIVVPLLAHVMSVYLAGQLFLLSMLALMLSGALALNRALFGRWSAFPLIAAPLLFNHVFLVGLTNFIFGIGLALWALAAWVAWRERHWALRLGVSAVFVIALYFCHLSALGVYGVGLLAIETHRLWLRRREPLPMRLVDFCATGLPFLPTLPLLLDSPTMGLADQYYWERLGKIDGLIYVIQCYSDIVALGLLATFIAGAVWAIRHRLMRVHPLFWMVLVVSAAVYLAMPRVLFATYMGDQRLPIAFVFMLIACIDMDLRHRLVRRGFLTVLVAVLLVRVIEVDTAWASLSTSTSEFRASIKRIKPGSRVLVAYAKADAGDTVDDYALVHLACQAIIERSALVTTAFTVKGKQIMHVRPAYRSIVDTEDGTPPSTARLLLAADKPAPNGPHYWDDWSQHYDYLYLLFTDTDADNPDPKHMTLVQDGTNFQLYRITKPVQAAIQH